MVSEGLASKTDLVAYPGEVITDKQGGFLGFVMRLVSGYRPLHELYSPKSRQRHFPKADYRFLIHTASNVARAVGKVHQTGCVIGDLNHSGILVGNDATVALIDADSFQFNLNGQAYPCVVGVPEFTPPELHGKNFASVDRTVGHDNFGLAVAIFHLLFMGRHPYAGRYNGPDISMGEAIAQNRFAFSLTRRVETQTSPPPGTLPLDIFPEGIVQNFEKAFGTRAQDRPSASSWIDALTKLEGNLSRCSRVSTHYYPTGAKKCIWCSLAGTSGFDMFPNLSVAAHSNPTDTRATQQAIREILAFKFPTLDDLIPQSSPSAGTSSKLKEAKRSKQGKALFGALLICGALAGLIFASPAWFLWLGLGGWGWSMIGDRQVDAQPFRDAFALADDNIQHELNSIIQRSGLAEILKVQSDTKAAIASYNSFDSDLNRELQKLKSTRKERQLISFLDRHPIRGAQISGIGPAKKAKLISFGIETAADVSFAAVNGVPGFGTVMSRKLLAWRRVLEADFRYNAAPNAQDATDENALKAKFSAHKGMLVAQIHNGLKTLRAAQSRVDALASTAQRDQGLLAAVARREEASQDILHLGGSVPSSNVSFSLPAIGRSNPVKSPSYQPRPFTRTKPSSATIQHSPPPRKTAPSMSKPTTPNCPACGSRMVRRTAKKGPNAGNKFWGCSRFPRCRGTRN
nr:topoisomerase DNA-binding C4 zinc finger domain-containing protein [Ruegeria sp. HKCCE3926]